MGGDPRTVNVVSSEHNDDDNHEHGVVADSLCGRRGFAEGPNGSRQTLWANSGGCCDRY